MTTNECKTRVVAFSIVLATLIIGLVILLKLYGQVQTREKPFQDEIPRSLLALKSRNPRGCVDVDVSRVDALTILKNKTRLLFIGNHHWWLQGREIPTMQKARLNVHLLPLIPWEPYAKVDAAFPLNVDLVNGQCRHVNKLMLYQFVCSFAIVLEF